MGATFSAVEIDLTTSWFDWVSLGAAALGPIAVAIIALAIGERKAERRFNRQITEVASQFAQQLAQADQRWKNERDLEARKWEIAQRREAYVRHISTAGEFLLSAGSLIHQRSRGAGWGTEATEAHLQLWVEYGNALDVVRVVGSSAYVELADILHDRIGNVRGMVTAAGSSGDAGDIVALMPELEVEALVGQARAEVARL